jgi:uroporphyrinogen-III synthase
MSTRKKKTGDERADASSTAAQASVAEGEPEGRLTENAAESETPAPQIATAAEPRAAAPQTERATMQLPRHWPATLLIMVVVAFAIGSLAAYWPQLSGRGGEDRIAALEARIAELGNVAPASAAQGAVTPLQRRLESVETRLGTLERNAPTIFNEAAGATLDQRVTALETARAESTQAVGALGARLSSLEAATPADLPQRLQSFALGSQLAGVEARVAQLEGLRDAASVLALARLARAADEGRPYLREFRALQTVAPEDTAIRSLEPYAEMGVPTIAMLTARFPEAARIAINAERAGLADGFWGRLWARFRNLISIRRIAMAEGDDTESRLARAQSALAAGNLTEAVEETAALEGDGATAIQPWLRDAQGRLAIDRAITDMDERVTQVLAVRAAARPEPVPLQPTPAAPAPPAPARAAAAGATAPAAAPPPLPAPAAPPGAAIP